ncbi:hypothetical protein ACFXDE_32800 [Kitasatospora sp. NPDC059408]
MTADAARQPARPAADRPGGPAPHGRAMRVLPSRKTESGEPK